MNLATVYGNITQALTHLDRPDPISHMVFMVLTLTCFFIFLYFTGVLLTIFFSTPHLQENARYILFVHILITDTIYLALVTFVLISIIYDMHFPVSICIVILALAITSFRVTPYSLAIMSLERYVAICFPLRHLEFCSRRRAKSVIVTVWVVGFSPSIADFIAITCSVEESFFSRNLVCDRSMLVISPQQNLIQTFVHLLSFTLVVFIILFTYVKVMLVAKRFGSQGSSALKAGKTVLLHAIQLMLCMVSFISSIVESSVPNYSPILITSGFLMFTCLPRLLSPLIYGIRDEVFQKSIRKLYSFKLYSNF